ncbi:putative bifunctional diguanylate cyclase/phosphodiesterase [Hephaestia mangrovi]|uniref:putative bifunctional diguanylate cyclase/phosphodiesterase n=1 Tax=Hephaestia mangrovi TaxID=2873268 RepID=UPI001CA629F0|nr:EAL domain-containing protein [Hephaestia mangrovi]MBY8828767.1 EAL domain-containing protein [Hephaestia mangrovi]
MVASKHETAERIAPTLPAGNDAHPLEVRAGALELLPIPAVMVTIADGTFRFEEINTPFRQTGLGTSAARSPLAHLLGGRVRSFLGSDRDSEQFPWQVGDAVDCRHYRVMLARSRIDPVHRCLVTLVDQTSEVRTEYSLRREMLTDSLTGLPNRAGFSDRLEELIEGDAAPSAGCAVMVVDLDRFSRVNACLGSLAGDELLITVARRLKGSLRARDTLARIGGDEFAILLTLDEGREEATRAAQRIQAALSTPFRLSDLEFRVACSIGVAFSGEDERDAEALIRHAQFAVNRAKKSGIAEVYHSGAFVIAREQFATETALRRAIDDEALSLQFQPIVDLATGRVASFEALARWTDAGGTARSPAEFIPVAEESGLIVPLGRWALGHAARTLAGWDVRAGGNCGIGIAVNISAIQIQRDTIAPVVEQALAAAGLAGERLTLELTESAIVTDPDRAAATLHALRALGTTLAMDDFGTGYSNLGHLQKLPIDVLKIDQSFVTDMLADRDKVAIVRAILSLAQTLGMRTTAEGIETHELGQTLAALGCTHGQGYAYARPLDPEAAFAYLAERNQLATA